MTGPVFDRGYFRELLIMGTIITVAGVMMLSLAQKYYQILLAQGVCIGIGGAILFVPSISLVTSRFRRRRSLAVFVATSGTAIGSSMSTTSIWTDRATKSEQAGSSIPSSSQACSLSLVSPGQHVFSASSLLPS